MTRFKFVSFFHRTLLTLYLHDKEWKKNAHFKIIYFTQYGCYILSVHSLDIRIGNKGTVF